MATFKLNIAAMDHCPAPAVVADAMDEFGLPSDEEFGVLTSMATEQAVFASILRRTQQAVQKLDEETQEVMTSAIEKVSVWPLGLFPDRKRIELYEGSATAIEQIGGFLGSYLALPVVLNPIELDVVAAVQRLQRTTERFQLKSVRLKAFAHNSYVEGPYAPKFLDSESGLDFMQEHVDEVTSAVVRFQGPGGRATVTLTPNSCFRYTLSNEDDNSAIQSLLRKLA